MQLILFCSKITFFQPAPPLEGERTEQTAEASFRMLPNFAITIVLNFS